MSEREKFDAWFHLTYGDKPDGNAERLRAQASAFIQAAHAIDQWDVKYNVALAAWSERHHADDSKSASRGEPHCKHCGVGIVIAMMPMTTTAANAAGIPAAHKGCPCPSCGKSNTEWDYRLRDDSVTATRVSEHLQVLIDEVIDQVDDVVMRNSFRERYRALMTLLGVSQ